MPSHSQTFRIEGLKDLDKALRKLPRATGKNVLRRVARKALEPIIADAKTKVHVGLTGRLKDSLAVSPKLNFWQKRSHKKIAPVEMFAGVGAHTLVPQGVWEEFGVKRGKKKIKSAPHPFLRPAWDAGKTRMLSGIKRDLWAEIRRAAERVARKRARALKR